MDLKCVRVKERMNSHTAASETSVHSYELIAFTLKLTDRIGNDLTGGCRDELDPIVGPHGPSPSQNRIRMYSNEATTHWYRLENG